MELTETQKRKQIANNILGQRKKPAYKIKSYIQNKIFIFKRYIKLLNSMWKLNAVIKWYEDNAGEFNAINNTLKELLSNRDAQHSDIEYLQREVVAQRKIIKQLNSYKLNNNDDNIIDKCAEEISRVYGGDVNDEDINNIKKIINKYINLSKKGGE